MRLYPALFAIWSWIGGNAHAGTTLKFTFNPGNGTTFIETARWTTTASGAPGEPAKVDVSNARAEYSIIKKATEYHVRCRLLSAPDMQTSPQTEAVVYAISGQRQIYVLDTRGRLKYAAGVKETLGAGGIYETISGMLKMMGIDDIKAFVEQQWTARELFLASTLETVETDKDFEIEAEMPGIAGVGPVQSHNLLRAEYPTDCAGGRCATLFVVSQSDDPRLIEAINRVIYSSMARLMEAAQPGSSDSGKNLPRFQTRNSRYIVRRARVVQPETSLPFGEVVTRILSAEFRMSNRDPWAPVRIEQKAEYTYSYK